MPGVDPTKKESMQGLMIRMGAASKSNSNSSSSDSKRTAKSTKTRRNDQKNKQKVAVQEAPLITLHEVQNSVD
jgi:hypothetical protein